MDGQTAPQATGVWRTLLACGAVLLLAGLAAMWSAPPAHALPEALTTHALPSSANEGKTGTATPQGPSSPPEVGRDANPPRPAALFELVGVWVPLPPRAPVAGALPLVAADLSPDVRSPELRVLSTRAGPAGSVRHHT
jgi:hypothetical protein